MIDFTSWLLTIIKVTALTLVAFACLGLIWIVFSFAVSSDFRTGIMQKFFKPTELSATTDAGAAGDVLKVGTEDYVENQQMQADHMRILSWVFRCTSTERPDSLPDYIKDMYPGYYFRPDSQIRVREGEIRKAFRTPHNFERGIIELSFAIWWERYSLRLKARDAYSFWQLTALTTIALGMLTTIFITLSSTDLLQANTNLKSIVRMLAIVLPALGTAAAAVTAFYGPQADWGQASRTLGSITNLHDQMALGVWNLDCLGSDDPKKAETNEALIKTALDKWTSRYNESLTVPTSPNQPPTGSNTSPDSGASGKQGGGVAGPPASTAPAPRGKD
jgi:hypothetical protein